MAVRVHTENCCQFLAVSWIYMQSTITNTKAHFKKSPPQNPKEKQKCSWVPVLFLAVKTTLSVMNLKLTPASAWALFYWGLFYWDFANCSFPACRVWWAELPSQPSAAAPQMGSGCAGGPARRKCFSEGQYTCTELRAFLLPGSQLPSSQLASLERA